MRKLLLRCLLAALLPATLLAAQASAAPELQGSDWESWKVHNSLKDQASLQRGARNFMSYCNACHALKYERYQRMADDLKIPPAALKELVAIGSQPLDYITTTMPAADALSWFGKVPPDLSLITRSRGPDYVYRFLKTFYVDPATPTGTNNLAYPSTAMPAVISELGGVNEAVFHEGKEGKVFDHFVNAVPGSLTPAQFDDFVRDTVNFLDYVGEPAQLARQFMGIWVVLFLVVLTWLTWLLKKEYWKDVH